MVKITHIYEKIFVAQSLKMLYLCIIKQIQSDKLEYQFKNKCGFNDLNFKKNLV
jgi:hypothetical protein